MANEIEAMLSEYEGDDHSNESMDKNAAELLVHLRASSSLSLKAAGSLSFRPQSDAVQVCFPAARGKTQRHSKAAWKKCMLPLDNLLIFLDNPGTADNGAEPTDRRSTYRMLWGLVATQVCPLRDMQHRADHAEAGHHMHPTANPYRMFVSPITDYVLDKFDQKYVQPVVRLGTRCVKGERERERERL